MILDRWFKKQKEPPKDVCCEAIEVYLGLLGQVDLNEVVGKTLNPPEINGYAPGLKCPYACIKP